MVVDAVVGALLVRVCAWIRIATQLLGGSSLADQVMAGVPFVNEVFAATGCTVTWHLDEGAEVGEEQVRR